MIKALWLGETLAPKSTPLDLINGNNAIIRFTKRGTFAWVILIVLYSQNTTLVTKLNKNILVTKRQIPKEKKKQIEK